MPFAIRLHFIQGRLNPADLPSRRHDYTAPPTNTPSDTSADSEEGGGGTIMIGKQPWAQVIGTKMEEAPSGFQARLRLWSDSSGEDK